LQYSVNKVGYSQGYVYSAQDKEHCAHGKAVYKFVAQDKNKVYKGD